MKEVHTPSFRQRELLAKLESRSRECPGLYPLKTGEDFRRVAVDHAGGEDEAICRVLEAMWQRPDEAVQLNAQSLIGRGQGLADREGGGGQLGDPARARKESLAKRLPDAHIRGAEKNEGNDQPIRLGT